VSATRARQLLEAGRSRPPLSPFSSHLTSDIAVHVDENGATSLEEVGAGEGNRTPDLLITSEPLCRLSYPGLGHAPKR
jgi:hypothetical protein